MARLGDTEKASVVVEARRLDTTDGRAIALQYLAEHGMGGHASNGYASAHRILDYLTFRYVDCVPREHPLWRKWRADEDAAIKRRLESRQHKPALMERSGGKCEWCGRDVEGSRATVDHIDPEGGSGLDNLALLCRSCNSRKSNGSLDRLQSIETAYLRRQQLNEAMAIEIGFSSYAAMRRADDCPCSLHGCPPWCTGCEMCGHTGLPHIEETRCPNWIEQAYARAEGDEAECEPVKCQDAGECLWLRPTPLNSTEPNGEPT